MTWKGIVRYVGVGWWGLASAFGAMHSSLYPTHDLTACKATLAGILFMLSLFFLLLGPSMIAGNTVVRLIPPARRALDREANDVPRATYLDSQKGLLRISLYLAPLGLIGAIIGVSLPL